MADKRQPPNDLDPLDNLEESFANNLKAEGYRTGLELGKRDGQSEGYSLGLQEGARLGSALGYYCGYTMTYKHLMDASHPSEAKSASPMIKKLDDILNLIEEFPRTNETNCEKKLSNVRTKFKQAFAQTKHSI